MKKNLIENEIRKMQSLISYKVGQPITEEEKESEKFVFKTEDATINDNYDKPKLTIIETDPKQKNLTIKGFVSFPNTKTSSGAVKGIDQINQLLEIIKTQINEYRKIQYYKNGIKLGKAEAVIALFWGTASNSYGTPNGQDIPVTPEKKNVAWWAGAPNNFGNPDLTGDYENGDKLYKSKQQKIADNRAETIKKLIGNVISLDGGDIKTKGYIMDTGGKVDENRDVKKYKVPGQSAFFGIKIKFLPKKTTEGMVDSRNLFSQTKTHRDDSNKEKYYVADKDGVCKILSANETFGLTYAGDVPKKFGLEPFEATIRKISGEGKNAKYEIKKKDGKLTRQQWLYVMYYLENQERKYKCVARSLVALPPKVNDPLVGKDFDSEELKTIDFTKITFPIGAVNDKYEFVHDKARHKNV